MRGQTLLLRSRQRFPVNRQLHSHPGTFGNTAKTANRRPQNPNPSQRRRSWSSRRWPPGLPNCHREGPRHRFPSSPALPPLSHGPCPSGPRPASKLHKRLLRPQKRPLLQHQLRPQPPLLQPHLQLQFQLQLQLRKDPLHLSLHPQLLLLLHRLLSPLPPQSPGVHFLLSLLLLPSPLALHAETRRSRLLVRTVQQVHQPRR